MRMEVEYREHGDWVDMLCPECGDPSDYCQDVHHWLCNDCGAPLDDYDGAWECSENENCKQ